MPAKERDIGDVARRLIALRERRGMTQAQVALKSGTLRREEVVKIETGRNQASTSRMQEGLARAFQVPQPALAAYIREDISLDDLVSHPDDRHDYTHHGNIEGALSYHADRWSGPTIAAGKAFAMCMQEADPLPPEWAQILDRIEGSLKKLGLPMGKDRKKTRSV